VSVASILAAGRRASESLMVDTCIIGRLVESDELDDHGDYITSIDPVYTGPCQFTVQAVQVRDVDSQGQDLAINGGTLSIPVGDPAGPLVHKDHVAEITLASYDTAVVKAVIQSGHAQTLTTARRFPVEITT
jgi:hypothetical protein